MAAYGLTCIYVVLNFLLWKATRLTALVPVQLLIYFYTLHVYLLVCIYYLGGAESLAPFMGPPFFAQLDKYLLASYVISVLFAAVYSAALLIGVGSVRRRKIIATAIKVDGWRLWAVGTMLAAAAGAYWIPYAIEFLSGQGSVYLIFKGGGGLGAFYPIDTFALSVAAMFLSLSVAASCGLSEGLMVRAGTSVGLLRAASVASLGLLFLGLMALGDRVTLMEGAIFAAIVALFQEIRWRRALVWGTAALVALSMTIFVREKAAGIAFGDVGAALASSTELTLASDETAAPLSQYIVMSNGVPAYGLESVGYLIRAFVPRIVISDRGSGPYDIFTEWTALLGGIPPVGVVIGYGFHYETDCYLTAGIIGVILGAAAWGFGHGLICGIARSSIRMQFVFAGVVAGLPLGIRSGIAGTKEFVLLGVAGWLVYRSAGGSRFQRRSSPLSGER